MTRHGTTRKIADAAPSSMTSRPQHTIFDPRSSAWTLHPRVQKVAEQTDLNIIVATGLYTFTDLPTSSNIAAPPPHDEPEPLVGLFVRDHGGIADTGAVPHSSNAHRIPDSTGE